jgi:hypothetical protein
VARLLYFLFPAGGAQGGAKMILRHVETLRGLGFDAQAIMGPQNVAPAWLEHRVQIATTVAFRPDDVLVLPEDAHDSLRRAARMDHRTVVFAQGPYLMAALSLGALAAFPAERPPAFMAVSPGFAAMLRRLYPRADVDVVPCFADERLFRPGPAKATLVALAPKKRRVEADAIRGLFPLLHPRHAGIPWREATNASEREVAALFAEAGLFLSLSRMESVGLTPLEAMASGCLCAGFLGVGGHQFATPDNGFWVPDEDCEAAADALAEAADLLATGGPALQRRRDAARTTAAAWSYARFRTALEAYWMRMAPDTRVSSASLD